MYPNCFNVQIETENNAYAVRHLGHPVQHFASFDELVTYLRNYLPIYPVFDGGSVDHPAASAPQ